MLLLNYLFKRILLFIFYIDLGFTYFIKLIIFENIRKFLIYFLNSPIYYVFKFINGLTYFSFILFIIYYIFELIKSIYIIINKLKINFLSSLTNSLLKAPALEIYYPLKTSIFSVTLRITGVFITLGLGVFLLILYLIYFLKLIFF